MGYEPQKMRMTSRRIVRRAPARLAHGTRFLLALTSVAVELSSASFFFFNQAGWRDSLPSLHQHWEP
jgi:hypothetical protein